MYHTIVLGQKSARALMPLTHSAMPTIPLRLTHEADQYSAKFWKELAEVCSKFAVCALEFLLELEELLAAAKIG